MRVLIKSMRYAKGGPGPMQDYGCGNECFGSRPSMLEPFSGAAVYLGPAQVNQTKWMPFIQNP
jgi:hypothetical protein